MSNQARKAVIAIRVDDEAMKKIRERSGKGNFASVAAYIRSLIVKDIEAAK